MAGKGIYDNSVRYKAKVVKVTERYGE